MCLWKNEFLSFVYSQIASDESQVNGILYYLQTACCCNEYSDFKLQINRTLVFEKDLDLVLLEMSRWSGEKLESENSPRRHSAERWTNMERNVNKNKLFLCNWVKTKFKSLPDYFRLNLEWFILNAFFVNDMAQTLWEVLGRM